MKSAWTTSVWLTLLIWAARGNGIAAETTPQPKAGNYTPPRIIKLGELPGPTAFNREAIVYVRFTVTAQGRVTDVEPVLDKGFYEDSFIKAAVAEVKSTRFAPAKLDGKPIDSTGAWGMRFLAETTGGLGRDFRVELSQVDTLLKQGDYLGADQHADMMLRDTVKTIAEYSALEVTLARTHAAAEQDDLALRFAEDVSGRNLPNPEPFALHGPVPPNKPTYYLLPLDIATSMLELRMRLYAKHGMLVEARRAYDELAGLEAIPSSDPRAKIAAQITENLASSNPLAADGEIWDDKPWHHLLFRNNFSMDRIDGEIRNIHLICGTNRQQLDYVPGEEWTVPQGWRDCSVYVYGAPGSTFHFVETVD